MNIIRNKAQLQYKKYQQLDILAIYNLYYYIILGDDKDLHNAVEYA